MFVCEIVWIILCGCGEWVVWFCEGGRFRCFVREMASAPSMSGAFAVFHFSFFMFFFSFVFWWVVCLVAEKMWGRERKVDFFFLLWTWILYCLEFGNTGASDRLSSIPLSIVMFLKFLFCRERDGVGGIICFSMWFFFFGDFEGLIEDFAVSVECVNICKFSKGDGSVRHDCSVLSCAWKAPRVLSGFLASTAHSPQCSLSSCAGSGGRNRIKYVSCPRIAAILDLLVGITENCTFKNWSFVCIMINLMIASNLIESHKVFELYSLCDHQAVIPKFFLWWQT